MGNNSIFFFEQNGGGSDPFINFPGHWLSQIASLIDNSRYIYVHGSSVLQEALNCMSKFPGALVLWFANGSNSCTNRNFSNSKYSTQVKHISSLRNDLPGFFSKKRYKRKIPTLLLFDNLSSLTVKLLCKETNRVKSLPILSLAAAFVPPFTNVSSNVLAMDQRPCEIESRGCGPSGDLCFRNLSWCKNSIEARTGIEFPTMLDNTIPEENDSNFIPEVLVGTGSRTMTVVRIKSLKVYAFGFYVHPFDVCEKLGQKYSCIPEHELNQRQEFYRDLLREDINMTVRLVVSCNGVKINTVKDAFEKSLRARLAKANPDTDFSCLQTFGSLFSKDIPLHMGTIINFRRTSDGHLITEIGGNHIGAVHSKDLCRAFFGMYIGDVPICEQTKEDIGKNVASIIRMC